MSRKYLVVGASSGIGLALTRTLIEKGDKVTAISRNRGELPDQSEINYISYDVTSQEAIDLGTDSFDGLAYCPGSINLKPFHRLKQEDFLSDYHINVLGAIHLLQQCLPLLKKGNSPSVVLFSTVAVNKGMTFHSSIASAKGAIEGLTKSLAAEFAPNIRVNCIAPSIVDTPLASRLLSTPEKIEVSAKRHPLKEIGQPNDIATMAAFLLSEQARWITGQIIGIDGGMSGVA